MKSLYFEKDPYQINLAQKMMRKNKILVTGGAGFIGSNIVKSLLAQGEQPIVLNNLSSDCKENIPNEVKFIQGDVRNLETVEYAMAGCGVAMH